MDVRPAQDFLCAYDFVQEARLIHAVARNLQVPPVRRFVPFFFPASRHVHATQVRHRHQEEIEIQLHGSVVLALIGHHVTRSSPGLIVDRHILAIRARYVSSIAAESLHTHQNKAMVLSHVLGSLSLIPHACNIIRQLLAILQHSTDLCVRGGVMGLHLAALRGFANDFTWLCR